MWIKKSQQEVTRELCEHRLRVGLGLVSAGILLLGLGLPHARLHVPMAARIGAILVAGVILLAWEQRAQWRRCHSRVWVCQQCNVLRATQAQPTCACGGTLAPLSEMKWLEVPSFVDDPDPAPVPEQKTSLRPAHAT